MKALGQGWRHTGCISSVPPGAHIYVCDARQFLDKTKPDENETPPPRDPPLITMVEDNTGRSDERAMLAGSPTDAASRGPRIPSHLLQSASGRNLDADNARGRTRGSTFLPSQQTEKPISPQFAPYSSRQWHLGSSATPSRLPHFDPIRQYQRSVKTLSK